MADPQEQILGLVEDGAAGTLAPNAGTQLGSTQDEFSGLWSSTWVAGDRISWKGSKIFILYKIKKTFPNLIPICFLLTF